MTDGKEMMMELSAVNTDAVWLMGCGWEKAEEIRMDWRGDT